MSRLDVPGSSGFSLCISPTLAGSAKPGARMAFFLDGGLSPNAGEREKASEKCIEVKETAGKCDKYQGKSSVLEKILGKKIYGCTLPEEDAQSSKKCGPVASEE
jgi:hypothetical protein